MYGELLGGDLVAEGKGRLRWVLGDRSVVLSWGRARAKGRCDPTVGLELRDKAEGVVWGSGGL